jgi:parallel beta-helix repeat protein
VEKGAVLLGSAVRDDYSKALGRFALIVAKGQEDIAVCGGGVIDGQGRMLAENVLKMAKAKMFPDTLHANRADESNRPMVIWFSRCRNVSVRDITLKDSACWVQTYVDCVDLLLDHVTVRSVAYWNNDGIDLVDSRNVRVTDCDINSADDGICLKSSREGGACEDVIIEKCRVRSSASALKFGTASVGGFKRVKVRELDVYDTFRSAVALEAVDGATLEDVDISGITAKNTGSSLFIHVGQRRGNVGIIRNVTISDMSVEVPEGSPDAGYDFPGPLVRIPHNPIPSSISGLPGHPVRNVTLRNITITVPGGGNRKRARIPLNRLANVPEKEKDYPEFSMFGELPACGFYCRHAEGLTFQNVKLRSRERDYRSALVADDVKGLTLEGFQVLSAGEEPVIVLNKVDGFRMIDSQPPSGTRQFILKQNGSR